MPSNFMTSEDWDVWCWWRQHKLYTEHEWLRMIDTYEAADRCDAEIMHRLEYTRVHTPRVPWCQAFCIMRAAEVFFGIDSADAFNVDLLTDNLIRKGLRRRYH